MYFVYVIYSGKLNRFYTGTTDDLDHRIAQHNSAFYPNSFTSKGIPWVLKVRFSFEDSSHAYFAEKFIKRMKSKIFIENIIKKPELLTEIIDNNAMVQLRGFGAASSTKTLILKSGFFVFENLVNWLPPFTRKLNPR